MKRKRLSCAYFAALALLMWLPLNGAVALDNFVFGLRADHLLHASVYLPCVFFLRHLSAWPKAWVYICSLSIGVFTESVQYMLPYRGFDVNDMLANAVGITLGFVLLSFSGRKKVSEKG